MESVQSILEKINRDGVEKAEAQAREIIKAAQAKANALMDTARTEADKSRAAAEAAAQDYAKRADETIKQGARDTILKIEASVTDLLTNLLTRNVDRALNDDATALALVKTALQGLADGEITCGEKLALLLQAQLAALGNFTVVTDRTFGTGFSVKTDGGRVEHAFTRDVIAAELARRLRPDLAKLVVSA